MRSFQIIGWKTYVVATFAIVIGGFLLLREQWGEGLKFIVAGFALVALRDAIGKILRGIDGNRKALDNVRAAIETLVDSRPAGRRGGL
jgi:hypothetical protein